MDDDDLLALARETYEPKYPSWLYKIDRKTGQRTLSPPRKPESGMFKSWATKDQSDYALLLLRFIQDLTFVRQREAGVFDTHREEFGEAFSSPEPWTQLSKLCTMVSSIPPKPEWRFKTEKERKASQAAEEWFYYICEQWKIQHRGHGNGDLDWDMMFNAGVYGRMVSHVIPDPEDPTLPWKIELCDPGSCFPVWGDKYGLLRMTRIYKSTRGEILDSLDPTGEKKLEKKIFGIDKNADIDLTAEVTVQDVWTRWSRYLDVDGKEVLHYDHEYGKVPFVYDIAPGESGLNSTPEIQGLGLAFDTQSRDMYPVSGTNSRQQDIARKGVSFFHGFRQVIRLEEMIFGLMMLILKLDASPPQMTESGYEELPSPVDMTPGGHTHRRPGEKTTPVSTAVRAQVLGPLLQMLSAAKQKAGLPDNVFGIVEGSNVTGFAQNTLMAATKDRIQPYIDMRANHYANVAELAAYMYHGWGHLYVDDPEGVFRVPKRARDPFPSGGKKLGPMPPVFSMANSGTPLPEIAASVSTSYQNQMAQPAPIEDETEVEISRETFELVGFRPRVKLESWDWNDMTQRMNVAQMATQSGLWSKWTARDKIGIDDPTQEQRWIDVEMAKSHPGLIESVILPQALWETGNINAFLAYTSHVLAQMGGGGTMGAPSGASPADPSANGGSVRGVQTVQGDSQPSVDPARNPVGAPAGPTNDQMSGPDVGP